MNKKIFLILTLGLLMVLTSVIPVLAVPPKSVDAVLFIDVSKVQNTAPEKMWTTNGGIVHQRGIIRTVDFNLDTPGATLTLGSETYVVEIHAVVNVEINTKTSTQINHYHKWTLRLPTQPGLAESGEFVGTNYWALTTAPLVKFTGHAVLKGSGAFEGQILKLSVDFPNTPSFNFAGYLIP
jgi:hypothetical protein